MPVVEETEEQFLVRVKKGTFERIRLVDPAPMSLYQAAEKLVHVIDDPVLSNGRLELLNYIREVAISIDYHRYGNLGLREGELRKPIL